MNLRRVLLALFFTGSVRLFGADQYAAGEVLIRFKEATTAQAIAAFETSESLTFLNEIQTIKVRLYLLPQGVDVKAAVVRFGQNPIVEFAEPNYSRGLSAVNDPSYPNQWSLHNAGQRVNGVSGPAGIDIRWPEAMALFKGIIPVTVAVIDSGVAIDHPEILASAFVNSAELYGLPGVDDDRNGYLDDFSGYDFYAQDVEALDEFGHGTLVASIIAGVSNNSIGGTGISPTAKIMSLRVLNQFGRGGVPKFARVSDVALALDYAMRNGAKIVNVSLGGSAFSSTELLILRALDSGGALVVAAAGNGGDDGIGENNDVTPFYPASYDVGNLVAVAAQDRSGGLALFSNYGVQRVHIAAPGTQIFGADITRRTVFSENFQGAVPGWSVGSLAGNLSPYNWAISSDGVLADRLTGGTYAPFTNTWVRSPLINLSGVIGAQLTFDINYDLADDFIFIEASSDGINWLPFSYVVGSSELNWMTASVDISDFDGLSGYFRFRFQSNLFNQGLGVAIDNVAISTVSVLDPGIPHFKYADGTSFSAPMVAGVAALIMSERPDLTASQVRSIILVSARPLSTLAGKVATGGMLDAQHALQLADAAPLSAAQPATLRVTQGGQATFSVQATGSSPFGYQWLSNGIPINGATNATLTINNVQPANAGIYSAVVANSVAGSASQPSILGVTTTSKVIGAGVELLPTNIVHPNGNIFDQVLLNGIGETITADPGQVTRTSYVDLSDDIVQVEFSGAGTLSLVLDNPSGPAPPVNYNQPTVSYMKGHAGIVITGANETTNVGVFTVGRATANDPTGAFSIVLPISATNNPTNNGSPLFQGHAATVYNGVADIAFIAISSANGKFGGVRASNAGCIATTGLTGIYAPGVVFTGPVFIGDINASSAATPVFIIGSSPDTRITGGDLLQANSQPVKVSGLTQLKFTAGTKSSGATLPAQTNKARLEQDGTDVTNQIVVNP